MVFQSPLRYEGAVSAITSPVNWSQAFFVTEMTKSTLVTLRLRVFCHEIKGPTLSRSGIEFRLSCLSFPGDSNGIPELAATSIVTQLT